MRELIDLLQGDPYTYDKEGEEGDEDEEAEREAAVKKLVEASAPYVLVGWVTYSFLDMLVCRGRSIYSYIHIFIFIYLYIHLL